MIKIIPNNNPIDRDYFISRLSRLQQQLNLDGDITIKVGSRSESRNLNQEYRQKDYPTDVLSFSLNQELPAGFYLGDIFICYPIAREQARQFDIPLNNELLRLMIHGVLHLSGYDHEKDSGEMDQLQESFLEELLASDH
jgi:probable rRNA maturation factor